MQTNAAASTKAEFSKRITLGISGASGSQYAVRLLELLLAANVQVHLLMSDAAKVVMATETDEKWPADNKSLQLFLTDKYQAKAGQLLVPSSKDWFSPVASGSGAPKQMVICPCSMGTVAAVAQGMSTNLLQRAADVVLKERGQLVLIPRETPLSPIHLENMLKLSRLGVTIMPAAPGFYRKPETLDDLIDLMVARILDHLDVEQSIYAGWGR
ncbi:flavin prenyltransferase UbiX [Moritella sp. F3]|uniref:flavin prenyltransferase UbiX n=1 Tax=Moritella sp. F3 TaxID=2718882 RepID=UPI0018E11111|nr:flavin prenyltransferase UbiX [Moritella sp. F3]GIC77245.1 flavin prenyltransferase UbiX [Moritella sp. F1]GIC83227.1 flavin prenyltransferase UbiX [Moritella sp. F3]